MNINIRTAVIDDCERIRPLQKEIADLHHKGRPDLFKTEARYFTREAFAERLRQYRTEKVPDTAKYDIIKPWINK